MAHILIVEDHPNLQKIYSIAATEAGHTCDTAKDGTEALQKATDKKPDLILLDLLMPEVNGVEFLKSYDTSKHPETKIVVFSNMESPILRQQVTDLGANLYLVKSEYTPKELMNLIDNALAK